MRTTEPTPHNAADEETINKLVNWAHRSKTPLFNSLLGAVCDYFRDPGISHQEMVLRLRAIANTLDPAVEDGISGWTRERRNGQAQYLVESSIQLCDALAPYPPEVVVSVLDKRVQQTRSAYDKADEFARMQRSIEQVYDGLDNRTRFLLTFLCRGLRMPGFVGDGGQGAEFIADIDQAFFDKSDFLTEHAEDFAQDPQLAPLARAVPLMEDLYAELG